MKILRKSEVSKLIGLSKVTIWRLERKGQFPKRIQLSTRSVGWVEEEIHSWIESRPRVVDTNTG